MARKLVSLAALVTFATPLAAADCPVGQRDYRFEKTTDTILIIDDDIDSLAGVGDMAARYRGAGFIPTVFFIAKENPAPVVTADGSFTNLGDITAKDKLKPGEIPVFKGSYTCAK